VLPHHFYSPDFSPQQTFFTSHVVKQHLANVTLTQDTFRSSWEQAIRIIPTDEFAAAYNRVPEQNKKCNRIGGQYVEKS
jgi:hypothetical protein